MTKLHYTPSKLKEILLHIVPKVKREVILLEEYKQECIKYMQAAFENKVGEWDEFYRRRFRGPWGNVGWNTGYNIGEVVADFDRGMTVHREEEAGHFDDLPNGDGNLLVKDAPNHLGFTRIEHKGVGFTGCIRRDTLEEYHRNYSHTYGTSLRYYKIKASPEVKLDSLEVIETLIQQCDTTKACAITPDNDTLKLINLYYKGDS